MAELTVTMENLKCEAQHDHDGHIHHAARTITCSGITVCGEVAHDQHEYRAEIRVWCPGQCTCGIWGLGIHGPGEHK